LSPISLGIITSSHRRFDGTDNDKASMLKGSNSNGVSSSWLSLVIVYMFPMGKIHWQWVINEGNICEVWAP